MKQQLTVYSVNLGCTVLLLLCTALFSCKKLVTVAPPVDRLTAEAIFGRDEAALSAVLGIYSQMMPIMPFYSSAGTTIYAGLSADELYLTEVLDPAEKEFEQNALAPANGIVSFNLWNRAYILLYQINACIENLSAAGTLTPSLRQRLLGEVKFLRAFHYFYLANLFGDVPLVLSTAYRVTAALPRAPVPDVYRQVVADLTEAKDLLPEAYAGSSRIRPNKWTAAALLARVYLYRQEWQKAETEATAVINSGAYTLEPDLNTVFGKDSREALWQLMPVEQGFNTTEAWYLVPFSFPFSKPAYALRPAMVNAFEAGDARKGAWVGTKTVASETFHYPWKYKAKDLFQPVTEYYMVLRYAELLLVRAEARAQLEKPAEAKSDLDAVRSRASLPPVVAANKPALLSAIEHERQVEMMVEWGHRWFDLKRTGRADAVLGALKQHWQATDALYPVPQAELLLNPALSQNPGY